MNTRAAAARAMFESDMRDSKCVDGMSHVAGESGLWMFWRDSYLRRVDVVMRHYAAAGATKGDA